MDRRDAQGLSVLADGPAQPLPYVWNPDPLAAGTVDHPEELRPTHHYGIESRLEWADIALNLPGQSTREQW